MEDINSYILKIYTEKQKFDASINKLIEEFMNYAYELVDLSNDLYQIEDTILLNKISLKDYVLNSELCSMLKNNDIKDYSISELKEYMKQYEKQEKIDISSYKLALNLYEKIEEIESLENKKIKYETDKFALFINDIDDIKSYDEKALQQLYNKWIIDIKINYLDSNKIDAKYHGCLIEILNDILNYYLSKSNKISL